MRRYFFAHVADNNGLFQNALGILPRLGAPQGTGAAHTFEVPYIFNSHDAGFFWYGPSPRERALTTAMQSYWAAFARSGSTGNPNYTGGVTWDPYLNDRTKDRTLAILATGEAQTLPSISLGTKTVTSTQMVDMTDVDSTQCDFWDNNYTLDGWK